MSKGLPRTDSPPGNPEQGEEVGGVVRSSAVLLYFIVTLVLMCEYGPDTTGEQTSAPSNQEEAAEADRVPGITRLVCGQAGTHLLTPRVKA